jgi:phosphoserine phosphatase
MNLILQGPSATQPVIDRLAALAGASSPQRVNDHAWRCAGARPEGAAREAFDEACAAEGIDNTWIEPAIALSGLSDFKLLAMDMDSTLITIECIDEIADMQGLKPQVAAITEAAMRGEIAYRESLLRRVALLEGLDAGALQKVYDQRLQLSPGAEIMLQAARDAGLRTLLVSGGFTFFTDRIRDRLGLDHAHSNVLEIVDGKLTGKVVGGIVDATEKKATVERVCAGLGITPKQAIVMGDGANDLEMMAIAGMSVAFRAKPVVRANADVALNFSGLDGILNLFER